MTTEPKALTPMRRRALDKLLIQYLELPESEQPPWLEQTSRRLPRLSQWLKQLIGDGYTLTLLDESVRRLAGDSVEQMETDGRHLNAGDRLGPWNVIAEIGRGGMGRVYRGKRGDGAFEMDVAIKLIGRRRRGLAELLQRECRLLARLDHPSVTRLVDAGLDDQAGPFLVMEWVEGADLKAWLESHNPDLDERLDLFCQVLEATAHAHQRLIVHGDIKPDNIRVREDGTVKLLDFGVSRLLESEEAQDLNLRALTPAFAAPEQYAGEDLTPQSDIWSLGATLYWLVTGRIIDRKGDRDDAFLRAQKVPRYPELAAIIETACAEDLQQRYATAQDLLADLEHYRRDEPLNCMTLSAPARILKFARRHRLPVAFASLLAISMTTGMIVSSLLYMQAESARQTAERSEQAARTVTVQQQAVLSDMAPNVLSESLLLGLREAIRADELPESHMQALNEIVDVANPVDILRAALVSNVLKPAEQRLADELQDNPETAAALRHSLASVHSDWGMYFEAQSGFAAASDLRRQILGENHPDTFVSRRDQAAAMSDSGHTPEALDLILGVFEDAQAALGSDHRETLSVSHALGGILMADGQPVEAVEVFRDTLTRQERLLGSDHVDTINTAASLGAAKMKAGHLEGAGELFENVLERRLEILGEEHSLTLTSVNSLAGFRFQTGDVDGGRELVRLAIDISTRLHGSRHPSTLWYQRNKAELLVNQGEHEDALSLHRHIHATRVEVLGQWHPDTLASKANVAATLDRVGRNGEALKTILETHRDMIEVLGASHRKTLLAQQRLGTIMLSAGQSEDALKHLEQAYQGLKRTTRPDSSYSMIALARFLSALDATARFEEAEAVIDGSPILPGPPQGPIVVNHWHFLFHTIMSLYENWHVQSPNRGHDETAEYWRGLIMDLFD